MSLSTLLKGLTPAASRLLASHSSVKAANLGSREIAEARVAFVKKTQTT